jgi:DNA modification methylase
LKLAIRRVALDAIHPDPANARLHPERNLEAIKASLRRFGQAEPLVVQRSTQRLIAGHGRVEAMRALGWTEADIVEVDVDDTTATALAIALNRSAETATWDVEALSRVLESLKCEFPLGDLGFDQKALDDLVADLAAIEVVQDEVPAPPDAATTRTADVWQLGRHRLMCGDSASADDADRLLAGAPMHLLNCDPPYNVKVEPRSNNAIAAGLSSFTSTHHQGLDLARRPGAAKPTHSELRPKDRPLANDFVSDEEFARMLRAWFGNAARVLLPGRGFYIWGGYSNFGNYPPALSECGLYFSQGIIWDKQHPVLTRKDFMGAFEVCYYGWREGAAHTFLGPSNITDLWQVKKVAPQLMTHLTEKPCELAARAIQYSSRKGENVLDLFGGSGSTLIACEQLERIAFLMEIDALYCDVILERWQKLTGREATLESTGATFAAVRAERE